MMYIKLVIPIFSPTNPIATDLFFDFKLSQHGSSRPITDVDGSRNEPSTQIFCRFSMAAAWATWGKGLLPFGGDHLGVQSNHNLCGFFGHSLVGCCRGYIPAYGCDSHSSTLAILRVKPLVASMNSLGKMARNDPNIKNAVIVDQGLGWGEIVQG